MNNQAAALTVGADWSAKLEAELARLWGQGLPTAEIGRRLGISKNAVCGKAHRLHLERRDNPIKAAVPGGRPPRVRKKAKPAETHPWMMAAKLSVKKPKPRIRATQASTWDTSKTFSCMFPLWTDAERATQNFCGDPAVLRPSMTFAGGQAIPATVATSYCAKHYAACYIGKKPPDKGSGVS